MAPGNNIKEDLILKRETEKYAKVWKCPQYKFWSGEVAEIGRVIDWAKKKPIKNILIIGCGEGYGLHYLIRDGFSAHGLDLVNVIRFKNLKNSMSVAPIWDTGIKSLSYDACIAIDVLEHIPPDRIIRSIQEVGRISKFFYFSISCKQDRMGRLINDTLHMTVKPAWWWVQLISKYLTIETFTGSLKSVKVIGRKSGVLEDE